jgi:MFS family permease
MSEVLNVESETEMQSKQVRADHVETPSEEDIFAEDVAYGPDGLRGLVGNSYVLGAAFLASLGGFSFGYDQGVISIINVMEQFKETFPETRTAFGTSFMTAMLLLGAFIGCFFMPYLADRISRKWALTVVVVIFNIGAIIQTSAKSYGALVAGRAIGGVGVGTLAMVCKTSMRSKAILPGFHCLPTEG